ncbi:DUF4349 domain-containing protein [Streptacidiphilus sp. N1-10]|uniref:DUF4349 domain-containing protein n=1 Tax=Streptacidiphilus jeojiensis TaxID=3229225 RepID=A0ABV6XVC8_9ACTN
MGQTRTGRNRRRGTALGAVVLAGGLALGACSASSGTSNSAAAGSAANNKAAAPQAQAGAAGSGSSSGSGSGKSTGGTSSAQLQAAQAARSIIYTGEIQLRTEGVDATAARAEALVKSAGGYVDSEVTGTVGTIPYVPYAVSSGSGTGSTAQTLSPPTDASGESAQLVLRVPAVSYDSVFGQLQTLGTVLAQQRTAQDVTQQVVDIDSRVKSAQASVDRVRALYDKAQSIADVTTLEQDLTQRESDLESLEAQQQALESQAAMSTVTLELYAKATAPAAPHGRSAGGAALSALKSGWHALYLTFRWLLVALAAVLPFLVPIGLLMWLVQVVARRRQNVRDAVRAEQEPSELEPEHQGGS